MPSNGCDGIIRRYTIGEDRLVAELAISFVVYLCVMAGALGGIYLRRMLPPDDIKDDTRQIANVATGLIATLAALVLGLMVASAKSSFDARADEIRESGARIILLDRSLRQYGPETREVRDLAGVVLDVVRGKHAAQVDAAERACHYAQVHDE